MLFGFLGLHIVCVMFAVEPHVIMGGWGMGGGPNRFHISLQATRSAVELNLLLVGHIPAWLSHVLLSLLQPPAGPSTPSQKCAPLPPKSRGPDLSTCCLMCDCAG